MAVVTGAADRERLLGVIRDVARISDEALTDGGPVVPRMSRIHRLAVATLDDERDAAEGHPAEGLEAIALEMEQQA